MMSYEHGFRLMIVSSELQEAFGKVKGHARNEAELGE